MKLNDIVLKMTNGAAHILLFNSTDGTVIIETIWYNLIPPLYLDWEVDSIEIRDYEIRMGIHD